MVFWLHSVFDEDQKEQDKKDQKAKDDQDAKKEEQKEQDKKEEVKDETVLKEEDYKPREMNDVAQEHKTESEESAKKEGASPNQPVRNSAESQQNRQQPPTNVGAPQGAVKNGKEDESSESSATPMLSKKSKTNTLDEEGTKMTTFSKLDEGLS